MKTGVKIVYLNSKTQGKMRKKSPKITGKNIHDSLENLQHSEVPLDIAVEFTPVQINLLKEHFNDKKDITRIYVIDGDHRKILFIDYKKDDSISTILLH